MVLRFRTIRTSQSQSGKGSRHENESISKGIRSNLQTNTEVMKFNTHPKKKQSTLEQTHGKIRFP